MAESLQTQNPNVEMRISALQSQIDGLSEALHDWRRSQEDAHVGEHRLVELTEQCARVLESWRQTDERHHEVVANLEERLGDWGAIETRIQHESGERIRELERTIEHEWQALRQVHEEPAKELREQAATLGETCVAAANLALRGFERAEARIAALEQDLQGRMNQLSSDLQTAILELRSGAGGRPGSLPGATSTFPLESVMRIHEELRDADATGDGTSMPQAGGLSTFGRSEAGPGRPMSQLPEASALNVRMESLERAIGAATASARAGWRPSMGAVGLFVVAMAVAGATGLWMQRRVEARLNDAADRVAVAERQREAVTEASNSRLTEAREEAGRQVLEARQSAVQAQVVGNVLAAPDLVRYWLVGGTGSTRPYAQLLFSRSRGMVFSASRLPKADAKSTYQLWLLTTGGPVNAGLVTPDTGGRVTIANDTPPSVPKRLRGALLTLEPAGGSRRPSSSRVLTRVP